MRKPLSITALLAMALLPVQAQTTAEGNPFARLGYDASVYTFGEKEEFHDQETVVEIGEVLYNTKTKEVVGFVDDTDTLIELKPELQSMSIDPHCEKYYSITPYAYCMNNPVKYIDPDGKDVYGFDTNTGRLSITQRTDDDYDRITLGTYNDKDIFTVSDNDNYLDISKGALLGEYFDDISKSGVVFHESFSGEGIKTMEFLSFNSNIEMTAWGYKSSTGTGLSISPWSENKTIIGSNGVTKMISIDLYNDQQKVGYLGDKEFNIHTHPGLKDGRGGLGKPSKTDFQTLKNNSNYPHYIISKKDGIIRYYSNGKWEKSGIK